MVRVGHRSFVHRIFHNIRSFVTLFFRSLFAKPTKSPPQYLYRGGSPARQLPPKPRPPAAPRNNVRSFGDLPPSASHAACLPGGGGG